MGVFYMNIYIYIYIYIYHLSHLCVLAIKNSSIDYNVFYAMHYWLSGKLNDQESKWCTVIDCPLQWWLYELLTGNQIYSHLGGRPLNQIAGCFINACTVSEVTSVSVFLQFFSFFLTVNVDVILSCWFFFLYHESLPT